MITPTADYNAAVNNVSAVIDARVPVYLCPGAVTTDATGSPLGKTTHYYAVLGPRGTNPDTGAAYTPTPTPATHGAISQNGVLGVNTRFRMADVIDGTSNTLLVGEISWKDANCYRTWTRGWDGGASASAKNVVNALNTQAYTSNNFNDVSFGSQHGGAGANFVLADGSVRFVSKSIGLPNLLSAASRNGAETLTLD
jgi:prepilin-type processing-associated H-X9-DG protein